MLKKFLATATAAVMAMSLVACGSSGSSASSNDAPAQTKAEEQAAGTEAGGDSAGEEAKDSAGSESYKIGLMISPLATREEYYRTAEMLVEQYGADKFVMDVYPEDPQNEQEVTISKALNIAMDPEVKALIFDSADIGTIAAVNKIKEERPDLKILFEIGRASCRERV